MTADIRAVATPLTDVADLDGVLAQLADSRFVCRGEASHGTSEFYRCRALLSRQLIQTQEIGWIGVEGDWPDCWQLNQWVCGREHQDLDVVSLLSRFERWPTWMWVNREVADFLNCCGSVAGRPRSGSASTAWTCTHSGDSLRSDRLLLSGHAPVLGTSAPCLG